MAMFMLLGKSISAAVLLLLIIEMVGWKEEEKRESIIFSKVKRPGGDIQRVIDVHENKQVNIINIVSIGKPITGAKKRAFDQQDRNSKEVEAESKQLKENQCMVVTPKTNTQVIENFWKTYVLDPIAQDVEHMQIWYKIYVWIPIAHRALLIAQTMTGQVW